MPRGKVAERTPVQPNAAANATRSRDNGCKYDAGAPATGIAAILAADQHDAQRVADALAAKGIDLAAATAVHLFARLQRIAAIDEKGSPVREHHRDAGRAGKTGQPFQAGCVLGHVFALMLVR